MNEFKFKLSYDNGVEDKYVSLMEISELEGAEALWADEQLCIGKDGNGKDIYRSARDINFSA